MAFRDKYLSDLSREAVKSNSFHIQGFKKCNAIELVYHVS